MALVLLDRVKQTGTANTTVSFTLSGASAGFQSFAVIGNGNTTYYAATDASGGWEVGIGSYSTTGPTLTRTTILSSSNSGSAVTFSGTVDVWCTYPSEKSINYDANGVAVIGEALGYTDTGIVASFASTIAGYNQVIIQNKSTSTSASSNINVSNNASTSSTGFAELGINSTTFSNGSGCFNIPGASYLASAGTDLSIGTYGAYNIHFATNSNTTDSMTIFNDGGMSLGGYGNPGLGSMAGNKFVPGYTSITAAAGTTILTSASTYYQKLTGSTTQTIQLPDATSLLVGTTFVFDNDSSGVLTITDGATTVLDTVQSGSIDYFFLEANGTVAGSWGRYSWLPTSYDFSGSTANFGTASITNATWTGNTIATGYGGTGLTTFTAANNAIYSTSSSALAAGTLPVAAGGTGSTTLTANNVLLGNGTSALQVVAPGTSGNVLTSNGTTWTSATPASGLTITSTTTNANYNLGFQSASSGTTTVDYINTSFTANPSTGALTAPNVVASNGLLVNSNTVSANYSIPSGSSAIGAGPITVASGVTVTIPTGSRWVVL
jgi:hypothetical protein